MSNHAVQICIVSLGLRVNNLTLIITAVGSGPVSRKCLLDSQVQDHTLKWRFYVVLGLGLGLRWIGPDMDVKYNTDRRCWKIRVNCVLCIANHKLKQRAVWGTCKLLKISLETQFWLIIYHWILSFQHYKWYHKKACSIVFTVILHLLWLCNYGM